MLNKPILTNRLGEEASLYLRTHAEHAIAWQPWSAATLRLARDSGRPILLSIGYASCRWCHVMARESFEDPVVAEAINSAFFAIKVDREERPDVDAHYQQALEALGGTRGWPLTLFLRPDGAPMGGGGYYPKPVFLDIIAKFAAAPEGASPAPIEPWTEPHRDAQVDAGALDEAARAVLAQVDPLAGGIIGRTKFPNLPLIELLLRAADRSGVTAFERAAVRSLEAMCLGGLHDHVDGGFARYATDRHWHIPHYEKMLYDNAQFISALTIAWRRTHKPLFASRVAQTIDWLVRRMRTPSGALAASLAAEADGVEGGDRLWRYDEIKQILGADAAFFATIFDVAPAGGSAAPLRQRRHPLTPYRQRRIDDCLARLRAASQTRVQPTRDDKLLADWNALAVRALAQAGAAFDRPDWIDLASDIWDVLTLALRRFDGRVWHVPGVAGMLDDHSSMALAAVTLFEVTGERRHLDAALGWAATILRDFDRDPGGLVRSGDDASLIQIVELGDMAVPSGNAQALELFTRLALLDDAAWLTQARDGLLESVAPRGLADPIARAGLLNAADLALRATAISIYHPHESLRGSFWRTTAFAGPGTAQIVHIIAIDIDEEPHATLCQGRRCSLPIVDIEKFKIHLFNPTNQI